MLGTSLRHGHQVAQILHLPAFPKVIENLVKVSDTTGNLLSIDIELAITQFLDYRIQWPTIK